MVHGDLISADIANEVSTREIKSQMSTNLRENFHDIGVSVEGKYTHSNKEARIQLAAQYSKSLYLSKVLSPEYVRQVLEYSHDAKHDDSPDTIATFLEWAGRIRPPRAMKQPSGGL